MSEIAVHLSVEGAEPQHLRFDETELVDLEESDVIVRTEHNYDNLTNKPQINGVVLSGDKSTADLGIVIPTKTSDLDNDSGFITSADVPTKTSELINDGSDGESTYVEADELSAVATSGSYNDLLNKPTIPAAQVNADWDANSGVAQILNKPSLATVATSGSYNDLTNKPTIPAAQVNSDWNAASGVAQILNKPTIPTVNNATLTIQKNSTTVASFTANASSNVTADIAVPTKTSDLVNDGSDNTSTYLEADETAFRAAGIPYGVCDDTSTSTAFTATVVGITDLHDGVAVMLKNGVVTSASGFTINVNNLGAKPAYNNMATGNDITPTAPTQETTIFNLNYTMLFVYSADIVAGGAWICYRGYDANTNTIGYQIRTNSMNLAMSGALYRYRLIFQSANGRNWIPANTTNSSDANTQKTTNTTAIDPFGEIRYYSGTATVSSGSRPSASALWQQYVLNIGYSFNTTGAAPTLTSWRPVYLKCTPQDNGSAKISSTPYVQSLPSAADTHIYIYLGIAYSATNIELSLVHPIYSHDGTGLRLWTGQRIPTTASEVGAIPAPSSPTAGQVLMYSNGAWDASWQEKSLNLPYQEIPLSFDGTDFSTTLTPQDIAEGYTYNNVEYPPYMRSSFTKADLYGSSILLSPVYGNTDGVEFQSSIFALDDFGWTGEAGVLRIETNGGYIYPYSITLVKWLASMPTPADIGAIPVPSSASSGDVLTYDGVDWIASAPATELPSVSSADNGKVLRVENGAWAAALLPSASGVNF